MVPGRTGVRHVRRIPHLAGVEQPVDDGLVWLWYEVKA